MNKVRHITAAMLLVTLLLFSGCSQDMDQLSQDMVRMASEGSRQDQMAFSGTGQGTASPMELDSIPAYSGTPYVALENNQPAFTEEELTEESFEKYSPLDALGRCGTAYANIGRDLMPTEKRGSIGQVKPSGWQTVKYDGVDGKYLYNRCHLIGYQLSGENANERNLITGTRYLNVEGMLPFENMVADYVKETKNHVLYRVTPVYQGEDMVAEGVLMEGYSVEDRGEGVCFFIYAYNVQPGIQIDYASGYSRLEQEQNSVPYSGQSEDMEVRGNARSKVYHCKGQVAYEDMADSKYLVEFQSEQEAQSAGYRRAKR